MQVFVQTLNFKIVELCYPLDTNPKICTTFIIISFKYISCVIKTIHQPALLKAFANRRSAKQIY